MSFPVYSKSHCLVELIHPCVSDSFYELGKGFLTHALCCLKSTGVSVNTSSRFLVEFKRLFQSLDRWLCVSLQILS